jgi:UDP-N-acetylglucosamine transferase subunit ALG13
MNHAVVGKKPGKPRILVAPLDWGLGHATRIVPIVQELLRQGADPWFAGEGAQQQLLTAEFPHISWLPLKGYRVRYASTAPGLLRQMLVQSPHLLRTIRKENAWLRDVVASHGFDAVISDNRFGLYHPGIPSVFMTHQLTIKSPLGKWGESLLQRMNYRYINRFTTCWIPDTVGNYSLAGALSHPAKMPAIPCRYIGHLSRLTATDTPITNDHLLVMLSGPEPQRTLFENIIIRDIAHYNGTATVVRGLPGNHSMIPSTNMIRFYNHLSAIELNEEMTKAALVIARSGYSSIMDLAALQKKAVLVPTPGQSEQEYLGDYLMKKHFACSIPQEQFSLTKALSKAKQFNFHSTLPNDANTLRTTITTFLASLR